ncbi:MAG TPA: carbohydrate kinase family protein [Pseudonocardiaceae bacterium]|nr:carbohydrate kinase family protein [Pseudonocardiaceae bacterium]
MANPIVVVGDTAVDVLARYAGDVLPGGDQKAGIHTALGGAGANTAAWLAHLGAPTVLVGRVGDDPAGRQAVAELTEAGVRCAHVVDPTAPTSCVVVLVDGHGQRSMLSDRGAGGHLQPTDLPTTLLDDAAHLHLSGYVLLDESSRTAGVAMLAAAQEAGLTTSVDPQVAAPLHGFIDLVRGVDLLLPNTDELAALTGTRDPESAVALLDAVDAVAVTMGAAGACWVDRDGVVTVPTEQVECVDSTGAGDAFNAATLITWLAGEAPVDVLRAGVRAGTTAVRQVGAQPVRSR